MNSSYELCGLEYPKTLLTKGNTKILKTNSLSDEYVTYILHLLPADAWRSYFTPDQQGQLKIRQKTLCPFAEIAKCKDVCLNTAGRGKFSNVQLARLKRTMLFLLDRERFFDMLIGEIFTARSKIGVRKKLAIRLNGTSDICWENEALTVLDQTYDNIFDYFPNVQFYDYTKIASRKVDHINNYHLTWSYSEANEVYSDMFSLTSLNKAVVFQKELPKTFRGLPVIDGDVSDLRFQDPKNRVVGLLAKGDAKKDTSGFVISQI